MHQLFSPMPVTTDQTLPARPLDTSDCGHRRSPRITLGTRAPYQLMSHALHRVIRGMDDRY